MSKLLVAYFSASGRTRRRAEALSQLLGADLYEIKPAVPYTEADLNWRDPQARSTVEMADHSSRPALAGPLPDVSSYDTVLLGFPIWWYIAPTVINTFLESCDLAGKTVAPFATSGGSDVGETNKYLAPSCPRSRLLSARLLKGVEAADVKSWLGDLID